MSQWSEANLKSQYRRAKSAGWIPYFIAAGDAIPDDDIDAATLMAIASRETNMQNIKGDFRDGVYHGYSLMQLDIGSHPDWIRTGAWRDVRQAIDKGADALDEKREQIVSGQGAVLTYKGQRFTGKRLEPSEVKHTALAAYNSGLGAFYSITVNGDPDRRTTGHDYGRDVLAREKVFRRLLEADGLLGHGADDSASNGGSAPTAGDASSGEVATASGGAPPAAVTSPAETPTANKQSLITKVGGWAMGSTGLGAVVGWFSQLASLAPSTQMLIVGAIIAFGMLGAWIAWKDHAQTKAIKADPALKDYK